MDSNVNQLAREMSAAIAAAVRSDAGVEAVRARARAAGLELRVTLEASIAVSDLTAEPQPRTPRASKLIDRPPLEMSANDRRFLKSLRIAADEPSQRSVE